MNVMRIRHQIERRGGDLVFDAADALGSRDRDAAVEILELTQEENERLQDQLEQCSRKAARLTTLYAALERLYIGPDRIDVLNVVVDILTNVVGGEQCAVFEVDPSGAYLNLLSSVGVNPNLIREVGWGEGLVGKTAASGRLFVRRDEDIDDAALWEETLSACIPIRYRGRLTGVIAIFGMKVQKDGLTPLDREIFDLLSNHVAPALKSADQHTTKE